MAEARAPGKLVICGEYAVLCGAPAIAMAVEVRALARIAPATDRSLLSVAGVGEWPFNWARAGVPQWGEPAPGEHGRVFEAVAATLAARRIVLPPRAVISLDSRDFVASLPGGSSAKLGLGSSAAVTVALVAALTAGTFMRGTPSSLLFDIATEAHRRFQGGSGSGIDIAVAVHGGVVQLSPPSGAVRSLAWPEGLHWLAAWSGNSASTAQMLGRFGAFRDREPARFESQVRLLSDIATAAVLAWEKQDVARILECLADYDDALRALDDGAGIGIRTPAHERLSRMAQAAGAIYKTSGAGGGDFGIAFADSPGAIERLAAACAQQGVMTLSGRADVPGVIVS